MNIKNILTSIIVSITVSTFAQITESLETGQTSGSKSIISNGKTFDLGYNWEVQNITQYGWNGDDWLIDNSTTCPNTGIVGSISSANGENFYLHNIWLYTANDCATADTGFVKVYWFQDGVELSSKTYQISSNFIPSTGTKNGFYNLNFANDLKICLAADEYRFEMIGSTNYLALDRITWSESLTESNIDSVNSSNNDFCFGDTPLITLTPQNLVIGHGATIKWYDGPNETGNILGFDNSLEVSPTNSKSYYLVVNGYCSYDETSIDINFSQQLDTSIIYQENDLTLASTGSNISEYKWIDCNNPSTELNETDSVFQPTSLGQYAVVITNGECIDTSNCYVIDKLTGGLDSFTSLEITPNPVQTNLTLNLNNSSEILNISIFNERGIEVDVNQQSNKKTINVEHLPLGVYILQISTTSRLYSTKFIKK